MPRLPCTDNTTTRTCNRCIGFRYMCHCLPDHNHSMAVQSHRVRWREPAPLVMSGSTALAHNQVTSTTSAGSHAHRLQIPAHVQLTKAILTVWTSWAKTAFTQGTYWARISSLPLLHLTAAMTAVPAQSPNSCRHPIKSQTNPLTSCRQPGTARSAAAVQQYAERFGTSGANTSPLSSVSLGSLHPAQGLQCLHHQRCPQHNGLAHHPPGCVEQPVKGGAWVSADGVQARGPDTIVHKPAAGHTAAAATTCWQQQDHVARSPMTTHQHKSVCNLHNCAVPCVLTIWCCYYGTSAGASHFKGGCWHVSGIETLPVLKTRLQPR